MSSVIRFTALALVLGASGCMVHVQAGGGATSGSYGGSPSTPPPAQAHTPAPAPAPGHTPANPQVAPIQPRFVTVLHPRPNGTVTRDQVSVAGLRNAFGGPQGWLRGVVYYIPNDTMTMPDVSMMTPQAVTYTDSLNIDVRDYTEPVAGSGRYEFYAVQYTGNFTTSKAGPYQFTLSSSDGSRLYIDDKLVVDDDGRHLPKSAAGTVTLAAGQHTVRVDYFKAYRWVVALQLWVTPPGGQGQLLTQNI